MASSTDEGAGTMLSPDAAFSALGNETRIQILRILGEVEEPLSFTELRNRVGIRHGGQFNYHLDKLVGHFVRQTEDGYQLRQPGRRVVEAVLSGAITDDPRLEPTPIDEPCPLCDGSTVVAYSEERMEHYCTECAGHYDPDHASGKYGSSNDGSDEIAEYGYLGAVALPPAGLQNRTPGEAFEAASTWGILELLAVASRVCPSCSAAPNESVHVCEEHDSTGEICDQCNNRHAIQIFLRCPNCGRQHGGAFVLSLMSNINLLAFLTAHGINPVSPTAHTAYDAALMDYEEELLSVEPLKAKFTFSIDDDTLVLTVDDELNVEVSE